jgi:glutathione S-transferase
MKVYHARNTRSLRILWLLEELGLPYDVEIFDLGAPEMRSEAYRKVHPMGRVPALEDGDVVLHESGAIVEYVLARHGAGRFVPAVNDPAFPAYLQWLHYAEGMMMPQVNLIMVETRFLPPEKQNPTNLARAQKLLAKSLEAVEGGLDGKAYLAGDFSGADIMTGHACHAAESLGIPMDTLPNTAAYVARLRARPAFAAALAR